MHALRHVHGLVVPEGKLVDVHPVSEERVEARAGVIGVIQEPEWLGVELPNAEAALRQTQREGLYALEADKKEALRWLERAVELGNENFPWFERDPNWAALREDDEYHALVERLRDHHDESIKQ